MSRNSKRIRSIVLVLCTFISFTAGAQAQLSVTGVIRAQEEVTLRSEFSGIVQRIAVREGDAVREGQLLIELRNERQMIAVDLTKARLAKANASVEETKVVLDNADKELARVTMAADALPRKEVEDKTDQVLRLKANLNAQLAEVAQAKEEVRLRENELKETQLLAPFAGTVTQIYINRGDTLKPLETQILELVALEELYAELLLPSSYVQRIHADQKMKVQVEGAAIGLDGKVIYINPKIDASSRTFKVKVGIPNVNGRVRPGMLAEVRFEP
jgi:RND family efflux transporter MFP subunit